MNFKIGFGFDVHQLVDGRPLCLGGIKLEKSPKGALGHSDADVLLHAICDAFLGAANLRDIGYHFKNTDIRWKNISSSILLDNTIKLLSDKNYKVGNVDCSICLEEPKINSYVPKMQENISSIIGIDSDNISIKATTNESMGFIGRKEGIVAYSVVLIYRL